MDIVIMGAGGHAREIRAIVEEPDRASALRVVGFCVEAGHAPVPVEQAKLGLEVVEGAPDAGGQAQGYLSAVGDPVVRARLAALAEAAGLAPVTVISTRAHVLSSIAAGHAAVVFPTAFVSVDVMVGQHVHINAGSSVSHDAVLDDYSTVGPGCRVTGGARIGEYAVLGAGSVVLPGVQIGVGASVGAGAVVTRDVAPCTVVRGVPARAHSARG